MDRLNDYLTDAVSTPCISNTTTDTFDVQRPTLNTVITQQGRATHNRPIKEHDTFASQPT
jgi:hypothetical protein